MMKKCLALSLAVMLLLSFGLANAQSIPSASVTIGSVVSSAGSIVIDPENPVSESFSGVLIMLNPVVSTETTEESKVPVASEKQQEILNQITEIVQSQPVVEYFAPEVVENVQQLLPEETDVSTLQLDEFLQLYVEGYVPTSDVSAGQTVQNELKVAFEFATTYRDEDQLVAMIGILPSETKELTAALKAVGVEELGSMDENGVFWLAVKVEVIDGKVIVHLPEGVLELAMDFETVFALLSSR